jgi:hypothetical protein
MTTLSIIQARITVSGGGGGEYDCTVGDSVSKPHDISNRLNPPAKWRCVAAWYHVSDTSQKFSSFQQIDVAPKKEGRGVELSLRSVSAGVIQIAVSAAYEHD